MALLEFPVLVCCILVITAGLSQVKGSTRVELSTDYYYYTCPEAAQIVEDGVLLAIKSDTRMGASLLRLHFHDCFVNVSTVSFFFEVFIGSSND